MSAVLAVERLVRTFATPAGPVPVLRGADLSVEAGELCVITGPSGSGKTTLLNLAGLLDVPTSGTIRLHGEAVAVADEAEASRHRRHTLSMVFQVPCILPRRSVLENVLFRMRYHGRAEANRIPLSRRIRSMFADGGAAVPPAFGVYRVPGGPAASRAAGSGHDPDRDPSDGGAAVPPAFGVCRVPGGPAASRAAGSGHDPDRDPSDGGAAVPPTLEVCRVPGGPAASRAAGSDREPDLHARAMELLDRFGMADLADREARLLSGGEQQRLAVARALLSHPALLLADEPTGNLDPASGRAVMEALAAAARDGVAVLVVTHNRDWLAHADRHVICESGILREATS